MYIIYFLLAIVLFLYILKVEGTLISPSSIIVATWCVFPGIASLQPLNLYEFEIETHIAILVSLFSFLLAYFYILSFKKYKYTSKQPSKVNIISNVNYKILIIINVLLLLWLMPKTITSWAAIQVMGWDRVRTDSIEMFGSTAENMIYSNIARPLFIACLAIMSVDMLRSFKFSISKLLLLLLVVLNITQETIIFAARATLVKVVIFFAFSYLYVNYKSLTLKKKLYFVFIILIMLNVIAFITEGRNANATSNSSFFDTMTAYYICPFGVLNYYIKTNTISLFGSSGMTYGLCLLGFIYNIFCIALTVLFGVKYSGTDYQVTQVTAENVPVSPDWTMNAAITADYDFMMDFGVIGVIIGFMFCALVILKIRRNYHIIPSTRNGAIYIFMLYSLFRLSEQYDFLFSSALFTIFYIWLGTISKAEILHYLRIK